jgi:hypothetical protein
MSTSYTGPKRKAGKSQVKLTTRGTFFNEPERKAEITAWIDRTKEEVAKLGFDLVQARFKKAFKHPKGKYAEHVIVNRVSEDMVITDQFVIYGSWLEGTSARNKSTKFKGYSSFRKTRLELRKRAIKLGQEKLDELVGRLNR